MELASRSPHAASVLSYPLLPSPHHRSFRPGLHPIDHLITDDTSDVPFETFVQKDGAVERTHQDIWVLIVLMDHSPAHATCATNTLVQSQWVQVFDPVGYQITDITRKTSVLGLG
jgi:hypothetical protein